VGARFYAAQLLPCVRVVIAQMITGVGRSDATLRR
jgi:hypothetical protein